jgi:hypothetical protein
LKTDAVVIHYNKKVLFLNSSKKIFKGEETKNADGSERTKNEKKVLLRKLE